MYRKIAVPVQVRFAAESGLAQTLEGPVAYDRGDALLTGVQGECWPVRRHDFDASYEAIVPTRQGSDGWYRKHPQRVQAQQLTQPTRVALHDGQGQLQAAAGDWLLSDARGRQWVVADAIFLKTYVREESP